jgi:hypothetical protein
MIRPEHVNVTAIGAGAGDAAVNRFRGRVVQIAFLGESTECVVQIGDVSIVVRGVVDQYNGAEEVEGFFPPERTSAIVVDDI